MSGVWQVIVRSVQDYWQTIVASGLDLMPSRVVAVLLIAVITLLVARFTSRALQRATQQATGEANVALLAGRLAHLGVSGLGAGWILHVLGVPLVALAGFFGFFGLGLGMSLADILKSLVAGAYLLVERPYWLGDTIKVRDFEGKVEHLRLRTTRLRLADGRAVLVPNSIMLTESIITSAQQRG